MVYTPKDLQSIYNGQKKNTETGVKGNNEMHTKDGQSSPDYDTFCCVQGGQQGKKPLGNNFHDMTHSRNSEFYFAIKEYTWQDNIKYYKTFAPNI